MDKIIECVPNFSEGQNETVINAIVESINKVEKVEVLHVDIGYDANRTVITFAGYPDKIKIAAFNSIQTASELIDMTKQFGVHPRLGAVDVFPFIPVTGLNLDECIMISNQVAQKVSHELGLPVYMYEASAKAPKRKSLSSIRNGEYENLENKISNPEWIPDYGPATFNQKFGAMAMGAREFLIAYNVNLNFCDITIAKKIAESIRESGTIKKTPEGQTILDKNGNPIRQNGKLKYLKAIGWDIEAYNCSQISMNLTNYTYTPLHIAFETCKNEVKKYGLEVNGSELIGMVPKEAIIQAGLFYIEKHSLKNITQEKDIIDVAINYLGLSSIQKFTPEEKILEYRLQNLLNAK